MIDSYRKIPKTLGIGIILGACLSTTIFGKILFTTLFAVATIPLAIAGFILGVIGVSSGTVLALGGAYLAGKWCYDHFVDPKAPPIIDFSNGPTHSIGMAYPPYSDGGIITHPEKKSVLRIFTPLYNAMSSISFAALRDIFGPSSRVMEATALIGMTSRKSRPE